MLLIKRISYLINVLITTLLSSCGQLLLLEERRFWILEIFSLILGLFSSSFVIWRQRKLEHQTMLRIQRQINFN